VTVSTSGFGDLRGCALDKAVVLTNRCPLARLPRRPVVGGAPVRSHIWTCAPPNAEESIFSPPPVDSATRRAMSRPRPVEPAPLLPRRSAASGSLIPGPASATKTRMTSSPRCSVTANAVPSAVCLNTLPTSASTAVARSERGTGTGVGPSAPVRCQARPWSSASADQKRIRSMSSSAASQPGGSSRVGRRAARMIMSISCSRRSTATRVSSAARPGPSAVAFIRSAVSGVRSRCGRSAAVTRSAAISRLSRSAITLNAYPAATSSAGPASALRALRSPPPSAAAAVASSRTGRVTPRDASRSATSTETAIRASATAVITAHAAVTPRETSSAGT